MPPMAAPSTKECKEYCIILLLSAFRYRSQSVAIYRAQTIMMHLNFMSRNICILFQQQARAKFFHLYSQAWHTATNMTLKLQPLRSWLLARFHNCRHRTWNLFLITGQNCHHLSGCSSRRRARERGKSLSIFQRLLVEGFADDRRKIKSRFHPRDLIKQNSDEKKVDAKGKNARKLFSLCKK